MFAVLYVLWLKGGFGDWSSTRSTTTVLGKSRRRKPSPCSCHRPLLFATTMYSLLCYCCELQWSHHRQSLVLRCTITSTLPWRVGFSHLPLRYPFLQRFRQFMHHSPKLWCCRLIHFLPCLLYCIVYYVPNTYRNESPLHQALMRHY